MRQRAAVDVFEFAAERYAMRETTRPHAVLARELREVMRGRLAFDGRVGGDDQFLHFTFAQARVETVEAEFARADAVQRTEPPLQQEVQAAVTGRLLDRESIRGRFHRAQQVRVARATGAGGADLALAEVAAAHAVADALDRRGEGIGEALPTGAIPLEHVVGHALRRFAADAGQNAQGFDELFEECAHSTPDVFAHMDVRPRRWSHVIRIRMETSFPAASACRPSPRRAFPATSRS